MALCALLYLFRLGGPALTDPDEGRNAEVAREMIAAGDWATPHLDEARYLDKPPAFFWAVAASMRLFGVDERGARLPSALSALACIALTWWFARRRLGDAAAWSAAIVLALTPIYLVFARMVIFDMMLTLAMTTSIVAAFEAMEREESAAPSLVTAPLVFVAAAAGTMIKGPVALVLPLLVAAVWAVGRRRPALLLRLRFGIGLPIYAAIVLPWILLVSARNPGYLQYALLGENLQRLVSDRFETSRPILFYLKIILPGLFPWILYVLAAGWRRLRREAGARAERYAAIWAAVIVVFFSLVRSKRPAYILPLSVPIAILAGGLWGRLLESRRAVSPTAESPATASTAEARPEARGEFAAGSAVAALACFLLAAVVVAAGPGGLLRSISGGTYEDLLGHDLLFILTAAGMVAAGALILLTRRGRRPAMALLSAGLAVAVMFPMARAVLSSFEESRSSRSVARFLDGRLRPGDEVICFEEYRPGLGFYLRRPVGLVSGPGRTFSSNYIKMHIDEYVADPAFRALPPERLRDRLEGGGRAFVLAPRRAYDDLRAAAGVPLRVIHEDRIGAIFVRADAEP